MFDQKKKEEKNIDIEFWRLRRKKNYICKLGITYFTTNKTRKKIWSLCTGL